MIRELLCQFERERSVTFKVRARPGAPRTAITGYLGDGTVKIALKAAPEKGRANEELARFLAEVFTARKGNVRLIRGKTALSKLIRITK